MIIAELAKQLPHEMAKRLISVRLNKLLFDKVRDRAKKERISFTKALELELEKMDTKKRS